MHACYFYFYFFSVYLMITFKRTLSVSYGVRTRALHPRSSPLLRFSWRVSGSHRIKIQVSYTIVDFFFLNVYSTVLLWRDDDSDASFKSSLDTLNYVYCFYNISYVAYYLLFILLVTAHGSNIIYCTFNMKISTVFRIIV